ncbi:MAG: zinc ribbon domain-containing protein, partial [Candidatus Rokuibacteriota bacterium]
MICSGCGHDNRAGARFCDGCGARLGVRCPACETELRPGARFCDACGHALAAEPGSPREVIPGAQPGSLRGLSAGHGRTGAGAAPLTYTPRHLAERILTEGRAVRG